MKFKKMLSGIAAAAIAASAFAGLGTVAMAAEPIVLVNENFNNRTAGPADDWLADSIKANGSRNYVSDTEDPTNIYFQNICSGGNTPTKSTRIARYLLLDNDNNEIALNEAPVTVSFKVMTKNVASDESASTAGDDFALIDKSGNVILSVALLDEGIAYYTGGASSTIDNSGTYGVNTNFGSRTKIEGSSISDETWYNVTVEFDPTTKTAELTVGDYNIHNISVETTAPLRSLQISAGRLAASASAGTTAQVEGFIDDILITRENIEVKKANVTFTGNATTVSVNNEIVTEAGIELVADTYSYIAKADGCITEYGTFEVTDGDAESGTKEVNITLTQISAAPESTNASEGFNPVDIIADCFNKEAVSFTNIPAIKHGEQVVIEYDVFVTGDNTFNMTLTGTDGGTGANTEFIASENEVLVRNQNSRDDYTKLGTYSKNQWVHAKLSFKAVPPTEDVIAAGIPESTIRTENVTLVVSDANGKSLFSHANITPRNLEAGFMLTNSAREYSFNGVNISGAANIANAEMYVIPAPTITAELSTSDYIPADDTTLTLVAEDGEEATGTATWADVVTEGTSVQTVVINVTNPTDGVAPTVTVGETEYTPTKVDLVTNTDNGTYFIYQFVGFEDLTGATVSYEGAADVVLEGTSAN